jgi:hypothetical protein
LLKQFSKQKRQHKELLPLCLGIATSANIGSAATVFGNPQNAFIASSAGVTLLQFIVALLPAALIGTIVNIGLLYLFLSCNCEYQSPCKKRKPPSVNVKYSSTDETPKNNTGGATTMTFASNNLRSNSDYVISEQCSIELRLDSQRDLDTVSISSEKNDFTQSYSASDKNANKQVSISVERREIAESMSRNSHRHDNASKSAEPS